jgi:hypothetical protein
MQAVNIDVIQGRIYRLVIERLYKAYYTDILYRLVLQIAYIRQVTQTGNTDGFYRLYRLAIET